jgi:hypothetical protein
MTVRSRTGSSDFSPDRPRPSPALAGGTGAQVRLTQARARLQRIPKLTISSVMIFARRT